MKGTGNPHSTSQTWRWPGAIAATSSMGLVAALVGDGAWDLFSWVTLAIPVLVTGIAWRRAAHSDSPG